MTNRNSMHNVKPSFSLSLVFFVCVPQSIDCLSRLHFRPHTSILCHWSKYQLLTTPIFPQNSDKTREWAGVPLLKPLSLLFYYYSPQRPHLRPAISLKPVRVSASRTDTLMGGQRCVWVCVSVYIHLQIRGCVYVACFWIYCVFYRLWADCWMGSVKHSIRPSL